MLRLSQRGDTLVEVLISIMIVSSVLTGAYVTTNRSTMGIRDSQEHAEALKLAQGQLELVRQNISQPNAPVFLHAINSDFCMIQSPTSGADIASGTACVRTGGDQPATATDQPAYSLAVQRSPCGLTLPSGPSPCNKFTIKVTWDSAVIDGRSLEQIITRLYKP